MPGHMNAVTPPNTPAPAAQPTVPPKAGNRRRRGRRDAPGTARRPVHPLLEDLAQLHPALFGPRLRPLKLGTYQDLLARHPGRFQPAELKEALGQHARSTRYLDVLARGEQRHDLDGQPVGPLALEHQHHALMELFKRRQLRSREDLQPALRARVRELFLASGLDRAGYAAAAKVSPDLLAALLDQANLDQASEIARREALLRAFEASASSVEAFADRYGMSAEAVTAVLAQARDDRRARTPV